MKYDFFVNGSKEFVRFVRIALPERKIYSPSEDTMEQHLESLRNSSVIVSYFNSRPYNYQIWTVRMFHQQHTSNPQRELESIISIVSPEISLDPYTRNVLATLGHIAQDLEGALDKAQEYLQREKEFDWICRNMYKQNLPFLRAFYTLQNRLISAAEFFDRLRQ